MPSFVTAETSNIIYVDDGGGADFTKIQDAINAVNDGDTIFVYDGLYNENIRINKQILLIGQDKNDTIINGQFKSIPIWVSASNVSIKGFNIINSINDGFSSGIFIKGTNTHISHCILQGNDCGIRISYANNIVIDHCIIKDNNAPSIYACGSSNITIESNNIFNNGNNSKSITGSITFFTSSEEKTQSNIVICNCSIHDNAIRGISIGDAWKEFGYKKVTIEHNFISNHKQNGIYIWNSDVNILNNVIAANGMDDAFCGGITISGTKGLVKILGNQIEKNIRFGVFFLRSSQNIINQNNFIDNGINAFFQFSDVPTLFNHWDNNYWDDLKLPNVKIIHGIHHVYFFIMFRNFDWNPAIKPFDIEVGI